MFVKKTHWVSFFLLKNNLSYDYGEVLYAIESDNFEIYRCEFETVVYLIVNILVSLSIWSILIVIYNYILSCYCTLR